MSLTNWLRDSFGCVTTFLFFFKCFKVIVTRWHQSSDWHGDVRWINLLQMSLWPVCWHAVLHLMEALPSRFLLKKYIWKIPFYPQTSWSCFFDTVNAIGVAPNGIAPTANAGSSEISWFPGQLLSHVLLWWRNCTVGVCVIWKQGNWPGIKFFSNPIE